MAKAFVRGEEKRLPAGLRQAIACALLALLLIFAAEGTDRLAGTGRAEALRIMEQAVRRSVVQCYAIEGRYPKSVDYLAEHYGLIVDREQYVYHYRPVADNLMPEIAVFPKEAGA